MNKLPNLPINHSQASRIQLVPGVCLLAFLPGILCPLPFTLVENALQISSFMQNKPNFRKAKMNVSAVNTKDYERNDIFAVPENKANSNPIKANTKPIKANKMPKQTQSNPISKAKNAAAFDNYWAGSWAMPANSGLTLLGFLAILSPQRGCSQTMILLKTPVHAGCSRPIPAGANARIGAG